MKKFSSWRKLIRVTAYVRRLIQRCRKKNDERSPINHQIEPSDISLLPQELKSELFWIKKSQKSLADREAINKARGEFKLLTPFRDENDVIRVGGKISKTYDTKHPVLLPSVHWISRLIDRHAHQFGHNGVAATTAKTRKKYWIVKANDLEKSVKYKRVLCKKRLRN